MEQGIPRWRRLLFEICLLAFPFAVLAGLVLGFLNVHGVSPFGLSNETLLLLLLVVGLPLGMVFGTLLDKGFFGPLDKG